MTVSVPLSCFPIGILIVFGFIAIISICFKIKKLSSKNKNTIEYEITDDNFPLGGRIG